MSQILHLDQIRARNALARGDVREEDGGDQLSGYPSLVINNGLIATLAFSLEKGGQHARIADAIAAHLKDLGIIPSDGGEALRDALCHGTSFTLCRATREALAFLAYLKRFHR